MTDTERLRAVISESGLKLSFIAKKIGITPYGLSLKIENKNEFKASEIQTLKEMLNLSNKERDSIFFVKRVD